MLGLQRLQQLGGLSATLPSFEEHHRLAGVLVDRPDSVALRRLSGHRDHHLLPHGALHGAQGRQQAQVELIGSVKGDARSEAVTGLLNRGSLTWYLGARLVMLCSRRLRTISAALSAARTVSPETRSSVTSVR